MLNLLKQTRLAIFAVALAVVGLSPSPAKAFGVFCPPGSAVEVTQDFILGVDISIETTLAAISAYIVVMLPLIEEAIASNAAAPHQANHVMTEGHMRINDALQANEWSLSRAHAQGESQNDAQPSVTAPQSATGSRRAFAVDIPKQVQMSTALARESLVAGNVQGSISQYGTMTQASNQANNSRFPNYAKCDELTMSGGGCTDGPLPDGDVNAQSVFGYDTYDTGPQTQVNPKNNGSTAQIQQAALDYCRNLITNLAPDPDQNALLGTPQGIATFTMRKAADARMSLAQKVCYEISVERQPINPNLPSDANNWGLKILNNMNYPTQNIPQTLSPYQVMKILYSLQFVDPNWLQLVSSDNEAQQMRLAVELHSLRLQLQWENQKSLDEIKLMKAAEVSARVQETRVNVPSTALPSQ